VKILLDANALMIPFQFRIDIFGELREMYGKFEPLVLPEVLTELRGLSEGHGKTASAARNALVLSERCIPCPPGREKMTTDRRIEEYAGTEGCMVLTNDRALRDSLLSRGVGVITLRNRKRLELIRR
jgi:rRNA-processing protein FCF1